MTTSHTPTPWKWDGSVVDFDKEQEAPWMVTDYIPEGKRTHDKILFGAIECSSEENAEFIIRACNAHDELIDFVKDVSEFDGRNSTIHLKEIAKELLAKAKGE
jgi:hypothetical protein